MIRVILFLAACLAAATGLSWLADRPGSLVINWEGYEVETSVFRAVVIAAFALALALFTWSLARQLWNSPAAVGMMLNRRRQQRGLESLSSGMIAIGAGDRAAATRHAIQARKALPNEPLTHLLRAQAAQLTGDKATSRRIFEAMLASPDTEQLGLRGLFVEAQREKEPEAARQFAERALALNPKLAWASDALFEIQCKAADWEGALETLAVARRNGHIEKGSADRRRAVLLTGQAMQAEDADPAKSLQLAIEAHSLAPDLVPAASLAGRMLAARGNTGRAAKILQKTWSRSPHPDIATAYAFARIGDSPRDRLDRIKQLAALNPHSIESAIAVANAAIDAKAFEEARAALEPVLGGAMTQRAATLMARIESEQNGDKGRVREWLARAVNAERDPVWTADGVVSEVWAPVSPVTGQLDAFQWRVPVETVGGGDADLLARRAEELVALGAPAAIEASPAPQAQAATPTPVAAAAAQAKAQAAPSRAATVADAEIVTREPAPKPAAETTAKIEPARKPSAPVAPAVGPAPAALEPTFKSASVANPAAPVTPVAATPATRAPDGGKPADPARPAMATSSKKPADPAKEPRIFVVPHAPDDPGPDAEPETQVKGARPPYRAAP